MGCWKFGPLGSNLNNIHWFFLKNFSWSLICIFMVQGSEIFRRIFTRDLGLCCRTVHLLWCVPHFLLSLLGFLLPWQPETHIINLLFLVLAPHRAHLLWVFTVCCPWAFVCYIYIWIYSKRVNPIETFSTLGQWEVSVGETLASQAW